MTDFWNYADAWLRIHFGIILGQEGILGKTLSILSTVFILLFNYLKYRFDVGYYHDVFGVPETYLGTAWNSTMTDFVLNALVSILQSFLALGLILLFSLFLFWLCNSKPIRKFFIFSKKKDWGPGINVAFLIVITTAFIFVIWFAAARLRTIGRFLLLGSAAIGGGLLLFLAAALIYRAYLNCHEEKHALACYNEECSDNTCTAKVCPTETNVKMSYYKYLNRDNQHGLPVGRKVILLSGLTILFLIISSLANLLGGCIASLETELGFLAADESLSQQLDELSYDPPGNYWAVLYRKGEQYVITPCHIDENEATVFPQYHCVVPIEGTVVAEKSFRRILIDDNTLIQGEKWNFVECFLWIFHLDDSIPPETITPTEPGETTEPTEPDETTEPTIPDATTEPPIPDGTTDTSISYEVTELHISSDVTELSISGEITWPIGGCDCCRCVPGLG